MKYLIGAFAAILIVSQLGAVGDIIIKKPSRDEGVVTCASVMPVAQAAIDNGLLPPGQLGSVVSVNAWVIRETGKTNVCHMAVERTVTVSPAQFNSGYPNGAKILKIQE